MSNPNRREFVKTAVAAAAATGIAGLSRPLQAAGEPLFRISLAQWSLHRALFGGKLAALDFARVAKED